MRTDKEGALLLKNLSKGEKAKFRKFLVAQKESCEKAIAVIDQEETQIVDKGTKELLQSFLSWSRNDSSHEQEKQMHLADCYNSEGLTQKAAEIYEQVMTKSHRNHDWANLYKCSSAWQSLYNNGKSRIKGYKPGKVQFFTELAIAGMEEDYKFYYLNRDMRLEIIGRDAKTLQKFRKKYDTAIQDQNSFVSFTGQAYYLLVKFRFLQVEGKEKEQLQLAEEALDLYHSTPRFISIFAFRYYQLLMTICSSAIRSKQIEKFIHYRKFLNDKLPKDKNIEFLSFTILSQEDLLYALSHEQDKKVQRKLIQTIEKKYLKFEHLLNEEARVLFPANFATIHLNLMNPDKSNKWLNIYFENLKKHSHIRKDLQRKSQLFIPVLNYERNLIGPTISAAEACRKRLERTGHMYVCEKLMIGFLKKIQKFIHSKEEHLKALRDLEVKLKDLMNSNAEERLFLEQYYNWPKWCERKIQQVQSSRKK